MASMRMSPLFLGLGERRLLRRGDIKQSWNDLKDFHVRAESPWQAAGSVIMAPAVFVAKAGNAIVGEFSPQEAEPLGDGGLKYISRDVRSAAKNLFGGVKHLATLHPVKALGSVLKAGWDATEILIADPLLDIGSNAFGHQSRRTRSAVAATLAA